MDETSPDHSNLPHRLRMPRNRIAILLIGGLLAAAFSVGSFAYKRLTAPTLAEVKKTVAELNTKLPSKTDNITVLQKVTLDDKEIVYRYQIGAHAGGLAGNDLKSVLEPTVRPAICAAPMLQTLMRNGYTVRYRYHAIERSLLTEIVVKPGDCGGTGCELPGRIE